VATLVVAVPFWPSIEYMVASRLYAALLWRCDFGEESDGGGYASAAD
jgi:hypothetical protein